MRKAVIATLIVSVTFGFNSYSSSANAPERADYIVKFVDQANLDQEIAALEKGNANASRVYRNAFKGGVFSMTEAQANALSKNPRVEIVEKDQVVSLTASQTTNLPWGLDRIDSGLTSKIDNSYNYTSTGSSVTAYVIDTGIRITHTEFDRNRASWGTNTVDRRNEDCNGHGTHVAGTIGGKSYGVAKDVRLVAVKVLNCQGSGTWSGVIAGIDWVAGIHNNGSATSVASAVANLSLGGPTSTAVNNAVNNLVDKGVVVVVAAGNENRDATTSSPASASKVITVGATDRNDARASFSNFGSAVELFAPGVGILSAWISGKSNTATATISGTSMASPHVAGVAARLISSAPTWNCGSPCTSAKVKSQLESSATTSVVTDRQGSPDKLLFINPSN